jgi:hypothetical protein
MIWAGWRRYNSELQKETKRLILASDRVVVTTLRRNDDDIHENETFRVTEEAFREQLAGAIEFGDVYLASWAISAAEATKLEFFESGIRTLVLTLAGPPDDLSGGRITAIVQYGANPKEPIMADCTEDIYHIVRRKARQIEAQKESQER